MAIFCHFNSFIYNHINLQDCHWGSTFIEYYVQICQSLKYFLETRNSLTKKLSWNFLKFLIYDSYSPRCTFCKGCLYRVWVGFLASFGIV